MTRVLLIEGGAMRSVHTAGALAALEEMGYDYSYFDAVIGASGGACNASYFLAGQAHQFWEIWTELLIRPEFINLKNLFSSRPVVNIDELERIMTEYHPVDIKEVVSRSAKFYVVATNCHTGKADYFLNNKADSFIKVVRASSAIPFLYNRTEQINGCDYIDGSVADPLPIKKALDLGATEIVALLTRQEGYRKQKAVSENLVGQMLKKYPRIKETMKNRHDIYNKSLDLLFHPKENVKTTIIQPKYNLKINRVTTNPQKIKAGFKVGYYDAKRVMQRQEKVS